MTIDVDDKALALAAQVLGTKTKVDTINSALREVAGREKQVQAILEIMAHTKDLSTPEIMAGAWRSDDNAEN